jgi:hypothetical protein
MGKIRLAAIILCMAVPGTAAWAQAAQSGQKKPVPDWVLEHQKDQALGRHTKKTKPPRRIAGTAVKGAPRVSKPPVKKIP